MDALPGTPQIQNIIPTTFFKTDTWAAPWLGVIGAMFILVTGLAYLEWRRRQAARAGEGYGTKLVNEPEPFPDGEAAEPLARPFAPLHRRRDEQGLHRCSSRTFMAAPIPPSCPGLAKPVVTQVSSVAAIWAVEGALLLGILTVVVFAFRTLKERFAEGSKAAVAGALLAATNTASEYGFGAVIAALPGFLVSPMRSRRFPGCWSTRRSP